jgi:DNA polymerase-4
MKDIRRAVDEMARDVAAWLARKAVFGRTVTLKVRYSDFTTLTRSSSAPRATQHADVIAARALALLEKTDAGRRPVRLLGVSVHNLQDVEETARPMATGAGELPFEGD